MVLWTSNLIFNFSLTLPDDMLVSDLKWLSVYCRAYSVNFGDTVIEIPVVTGDIDYDQQEDFSHPEPESEPELEDDDDDELPPVVKNVVQLIEEVVNKVLKENLPEEQASDIMDALARTVAKTTVMIKSFL